MIETGHVIEEKISARKSSGLFSRKTSETFQKIIFPIDVPGTIEAADACNHIAIAPLVVEAQRISAGLICNCEAANN